MLSALTTVTMFFCQIRCIHTIPYTDKRLTEEDVVTLFPVTSSVFSS